MQCTDFLDTIPHVKAVETADTAMSARHIAEKQLRRHAAICGKQAAELYGLEVLGESIETNKRNFTRFLVLAHENKATQLLSESVINKASLVFSLPHEVGGLSSVLAVLSFYKLNLTKIQSLPKIGAEWEYLFYINLTFDSLIKFEQALTAITPLIKDFKILGTYEEGKQSI